jgi:hypothetical protein
MRSLTKMDELIPSLPRYSHTANYARHLMVHLVLKICEWIILNLIQINDGNVLCVYILLPSIIV